MPKRIRKTARHRDEFRRGVHRFEHWYLDNQVYFITARCRDRFPAFATDAAKAVFWDRFDHYTGEAGFVPWVVSLLDNHYHVLGFNRSAAALQTMMQRLHGSVAKMVNDIVADTPGKPCSSRPEHASACGPAPPQTLDPRLNPDGRLLPFWRDPRGHDFFDGAIRDALQAARAYRYTYTQCVRHGVAPAPAAYPHTRALYPCDPCIRRAAARGAFLEDIPYARYQRHPRYAR